MIWEAGQLVSPIKQEGKVGEEEEEKEKEEKEEEEKEEEEKENTRDRSVPDGSDNNLGGPP